MKIFVVGLGLIGASIASGLTNAGHEVYGTDLRSNDIALERKYIKGYDMEELCQADLVILCLYPKDNVAFVLKNQGLFKKNQILMDVSGTKVEMITELEKIIPEGVLYVSTHPMAGKEKKGIDYANSQMFVGANFIICQTKTSTISSVDVVIGIAKDLGFKKITQIDKHAHDRLIGFTSQLPHALAVSLVNSDIYADTSSFTGDSYRDLTRIAMINEDLWQELFFENKVVLIEEISRFEQELDKIKEALISGDSQTLTQLFIASTKKRSQF